MILPDYDLQTLAIPNEGEWDFPMITPFYRDKLLVPQVCAQKNPQISGFLQRELGGTSR